MRNGRIKIRRRSGTQHVAERRKGMAEKDGQEILVPSEKIVAGDEIVVHMGNLIPFDGEVSNGEGMVNQASLTGESVPVRRTLGSVVYAGTVLEEGELPFL